MTSPLPPSDPTLTQEEVILRAQQAERQRTAQLLHDTIAQSFNAVYLQAVVLARRSPQNGVGGTEELTSLADKLHQVVREIQTIIRELSTEGQTSQGKKKQRG